VQAIAGPPQASAGNVVDEENNCCDSLLSTDSRTSGGGSDVQLLTVKMSRSPILESNVVDSPGVSDERNAELMARLPARAGRSAGRQFNILLHAVSRRELWAVGMLGRMSTGSIWGAFILACSR
jgi:hypothetical protein